MAGAERIVIARLSAARLLGMAAVGVVLASAFFLVPLAMLIVTPSWGLAALFLACAGLSGWLVRYASAIRRRLLAEDGALVWVEGGRIRSVHGDDVPLVGITRVKHGREPWWAGLIFATGGLAPSAPALQLDTTQGRRTINLALADRSSRRSAGDAVRTAAREAGAAVA